MPAIAGPDWSLEDGRDWLKDYRKTYLERDLLDLARLDRLEPFARAQKAAALRSSQPVNFADLARLSDVSAPTAKQFMRYLEMSYQVFWLPAWSRNLEKRLSKRPKLHFVDSRPAAGRRRRLWRAQRASTSRAPSPPRSLSSFDPSAWTLSSTTCEPWTAGRWDLLIEREDG